METTIIVCDECGEPAVTSLTIKSNGRSGVKDVCARHLTAAFAHTRKPVRGRRKGSFVEDNRKARRVQRIPELEKAVGIRK
jgi:hypothetical protein